MARAARSLGQATAKTYSTPAPIGGLNAVDAIAAMSPTDAVLMDNWFPQPSYVQLRNGYMNWATELPDWVETLMGYSPTENNPEQLFGISGTEIYDCTSNDVVGMPVVTGLTNARWEYTNVGTPGGSFLYAANAVDPPLLYDGTDWTPITGVSTPAITGVTTTTLRNPTVWKNRVWFVENNSNVAWYLPVQSVGGEARSIDLSAQFRLGGQLQAILTFTVASANSFDDYIGFLSSQGELAVYTGTDPNTAGLFNITGIYRLGKPIGRRSWFKYGADAIIICSDGFVSVTKAISVGIQQPQDAISYKIISLVNSDVQAYRNNFGWEGQVFPLGNKIVINVPQNENSRQYQYVMNTINDSWCTFGSLTSPWNAATFCVLGDRMFFGGDGYVAQCDTGQSDAGANIMGSIKPAFSYIGTDRQKRFTMVRPLLQTTGRITAALSLNTDFENRRPTNIPTFSPAPGSPWDTSPWNISPWASGFYIQKNWQTVFGIGFSATIYLTVATNAAQVNLMSLDYVLEQGSGVL